MFVAGLKAHLVGSYYAIPLMLPQKAGLIVSTVAWDHDKYLGSFYDISKHAVVRMIYGLGIELRPFGIAAVAVAPGFMRTEAVLQAYKVSEEDWQKAPQLKQTHSPEYLGRVVARLAVDPKLMRRSGKAFRAADLGRAYGIRDLDGRQIPPFKVIPFAKVLKRFNVRP
jgi:NAD(P)-dependent dehydrogenase (short-subunit alcohol dehydrogenase family)